MAAGAPGLINELGAIPEYCADRELLHPPAASSNAVPVTVEKYPAIRINFFRFFMLVIQPSFIRSFVHSSKRPPWLSLLLAAAASAAVPARLIVPIGTQTAAKHKAPDKNSQSVAGKSTAQSRRVHLNQWSKGGKLVVKLGGRRPARSTPVFPCALLINFSPDHLFQRGRLAGYSSYAAFTPLSEPFPVAIDPHPFPPNLSGIMCHKRTAKSLGASVFRWYHRPVMTTQRQSASAAISRRSAGPRSAKPPAPSVQLIEGESQAIQAIANVAWQDVLIAANAAALLFLARAGCQSRRQVGTLVIPFFPALELLAVLERCFRRVIYFAAESRWCPDQDLRQLVQQADRQIALGCVLDSPSGLLTLVCADLSILTFPLSELSATAENNYSNIRPALSDHGRTLVLPDGPHPLLEILEKYDAGFRRARRRGLWAQSTHPGERIRHLRLSRRLRREDIPGLDVKTIARIERGEIRTPQKETLRLIAAALQIPLSELLSSVPARRHNRRKAGPLPGPLPRASIEVLPGDQPHKMGGGHLARLSDA